MEELNGMYDEIIQKVDALLQTPHAVGANDKVQDECKDYLKMLHSIVNGEWSAERLPQDEAVLLAHAEVLVTRLCACIARAFELPVMEGKVSASPVAIRGVDVSLLAIALSVLFSLVKRPEVSAVLSEDALFAVFHECLHRICDPRITQAAHPATEQEEGQEGRETAQQVARALNNIVLKLGMGGQAGHVILSMLRVMFCCIPAAELPHYTDHKPLPASSTKPASRLVIQILSEHGNSPEPYSEPQVCGADCLVRCEPSTRLGFLAVSWGHNHVQRLRLMCHHPFAHHFVSSRCPCAPCWRPSTTSSLGTRPPPPTTPPSAP
jgi:hypothetical protein